MEKNLVLVINPGSTSSKVAVFREKELLRSETIVHDVEDLKHYDSIIAQYAFRRDGVLEWYRSCGFSVEQLAAVVGRGGMLRPMPSGTFEVDAGMLEDLRVGIQGDHASNLGGMIAHEIAQIAGVKAYIVDPVSVDEFEPLARISGIPQISRKSLLHALNVRAIAYSYSESVGKTLEQLNLIVAHIGGGISIVPLRKGVMIDANNANEMGPFSPERVGGLPVGDVVKLAFSGTYTEKELKTAMRGKGGVAAYLGTGDLRKVQERIDAGDAEAKLVQEAMAYQIGKEIGAMATVLNGEVDAIVLTGGAAYSKPLTEMVRDMVSFIAPVVVKPGEDEMLALNLGVQRVLNGEVLAKSYSKEVLHDQ